MSATVTSPRPAAPPTQSSAFPADRLLKRLSYIMLVRVILFTLLLGGTVAVHFAWRRPEELGGPYVSVLFVFIAAIYLLNILYAALIHFGVDLRRMAVAQIGVDLLSSAVLVHFTGSAESAFVLFFLLTPIAAAVTLSRGAAFATVAAGLLLMAATILLGHWRVIPVLQGQKFLPWEVPTVDVARSLLLNGGAMAAIGALAGYLADLLRSAASEVAQQRAHLADLEALHEDVVRCLTSGLLTVDTTGKVLTANDAAHGLLARNEGTLLGQPLSAVCPEFAALIPDADAHLRQEVELTTDGEARHFGVSVSPLTDRDQDPIGQILNFQDLTHVKAMERTAQRAEQLAALGRVAAGVAHEIRNPLASISGSLELLAAESALSNDGKQLTVIAQREIGRLDGLVAELLDYTRARRNATLEPMALCHEIDGLVASLAGLMQRDEASPRIEVKHDDGHCWIDGDRDLLTGMLWNLVRNASEAGEAQQVLVSVYSEGEEVVLEVKDSGAGIPADQIEHIFEPFFSTKQKGSGLGLAVVHRSVQDHGARIDVQSVETEGTTFRIHFPSLPAARQPRG